MSKTFAHWLRAQTRRDDSIGDLARDVTSDVRSGCLSRITSPEALYRHVAAHDGPPDDAALDAIRSAGAEWRRNGQRPVKAETTSSADNDLTELAAWLHAVGSTASLTEVEFRVLLLFASYTGGRSDVYVRPSWARVAAAIGCPKPRDQIEVARPAIDRLVDKGWLSWWPRKGYGLSYGETIADELWERARQSPNPRPGVEGSTRKATT